MQNDADQTKRNRRGAGDIAPRDERDIARDREELAQLIGQLLARRWLRNQRGVSPGSDE
ncbi:MAG: hypothetical protein QGG42_02065 [Phycisphaerae bacterium]|jgi:hypothetical protein|nr:hypothetical protein [Phycisphaerae bacterium]